MAPMSPHSPQMLRSRKPSIGEAIRDPHPWMCEDPGSALRPALPTFAPAGDANFEGVDIRVIETHDQITPKSPDSPQNFAASPSRNPRASPGTSSRR